MLSTIVFIFLFLIRTRFPSNTSIFTTITSRYGASVTRKLRKWERTAKQHTKAQLDVELLQRCYSYSITPKFLKFRLYRLNLKHSQVYKECQQRLLTNEIEHKKRAINKLKDVSFITMNNVKSYLSFLDFVHVKQFVCKSVEMYKKKVIETHKRKFEHWGGSFEPSGVTSDKFIFNLSLERINLRFDN